MNELESKNTIFASLCAGTVAGASGVIVGHPFDSLKVRLQVGKTLKNINFDLFTIKQLYRGILPPLLSVGFIQSINFSIYEYSKFKITEIMQSKAYVGKYLYSFYITSNSDVNHLINVFTAGTISGSCISIITTPISIIKLQQQVASEKGIIKCITDIYSKAGISGFYRGFGSVVILESLGRGSYLGTYEASKIIIDKIYTQILNRQQQQSKQHHHIKDSLSVRMSSAAIAGCFSWLLFYPLDVLKSRIQLDFNRIKYNNAFDCLLISLRSGGIRSLYSGISYTLMRAGPVAATILPIYEITKEKLMNH